MALLTKSYLLGKIHKASGFYNESNMRNFAAEALANEVRARRARLSAGVKVEYDIFLSHASEDAILINALRDELAEQGFSVYVDWIEDPQLDRSNVTSSTASLLRERMRSCKSLLFATSVSSSKSVWMPWELGYVDSHTSSRVAIAPIVPDGNENQEFKGQDDLHPLTGQNVG